MATRKQIDMILKDIKKTTNAGSSWLPSSPVKPTVNPLTGLQSQTSNATQRLNAVGVNAEDVKDTRNPLEKALNLTEDQNWIFDIFEVLGRPQQALFGGIQAMQTGDDVDEAIKAGWTGEEKNFSGGQIIRNAVQGGKEETGEFDWTDLLGFGLDAFLDPADIGLALATGGAGNVAKAVAEGADTLVDASKAVKVVDAVADAGKTVSNAKVLGSVVKNTLTQGKKIGFGDNVGDYLTKVLTPKKALAKQGIEKLSLSDVVFRPFLAGGKFGVSALDKFVEFSLNYLDEASALGTDAVGMLKKYKAIKKGIGDGLKKTGTAMSRAVSRGKDRFMYTAQTFVKINDEYDNFITKILMENNPGMTEEVAKNPIFRNKLNKDILNYYEANNLSEMKVGWDKLVDFIAESDHKMIPYDAESFAVIKRELTLLGKKNVDDLVKVTDLPGLGKVIQFDKKMFDKDGIRTLKKTPVVIKGVEPEDGETLLDTMTKAGREPEFDEAFQKMTPEQQKASIEVKVPENPIHKPEARTVDEVVDPYSPRKGSFEKKTKGELVDVDYNPANTGRHYGDLGVSETVNPSKAGSPASSGSRDTGHFGTGTYFVDENAKMPDTYVSRPAVSIDLDDYNTFKPATAEVGVKLHDGLKQVNKVSGSIQNLFQNFKKLTGNKAVTGLVDKLDSVIDGIPAKDIYSMVNRQLKGWDFLDFLNNNPKVLEVLPINVRRSAKSMIDKYLSDPKYVDMDIDELVKLIKADEKVSKLSDLMSSVFDTQSSLKMARERLTDVFGREVTNAEILDSAYDVASKASSGAKDLDSASTVFMKANGYEGVDVRGLDGLDNEVMGSVVYRSDKKPLMSVEDKRLAMRKGATQDTVTRKPRQQAVKETYAGLKERSKDLIAKNNEVVDVVGEKADSIMGKKFTDRDEFIVELRSQDGLDTFDGFDFEKKDFVSLNDKLVANKEHLPEWVNKRAHDIRVGGDKTYAYQGAGTEVVLPRQVADADILTKIDYVAKHNPDVAGASVAIHKGTAVDVINESPRPKGKLRPKKIGQIPNWDKHDVESIRSFIGSITKNNTRRADALGKFSDRVFAIDDMVTSGKHWTKTMDENVTQMLNKTKGRVKISSLDDLAQNTDLMNAYVTLRRLDTQFGTSYAKMGVFEQVDKILKGAGDESLFNRTLNRVTQNHEPFYQTLQENLYNDFAIGAKESRLPLKTTAGKELLKLQDDIKEVYGARKAVLGNDAVKEGFRVFPPMQSGMKFYNSKVDLNKAITNHQYPAAMQEKVESIIGMRNNVQIKLGDKAYTYNIDDFPDEFSVMSRFLSDLGDKKLFNRYSEALKKALGGDGYDDLAGILGELRARLDVSYPKFNQLDQLADTLEPAVIKWSKDRTDQLWQHKLKNPKVTVKQLNSYVDELDTAEIKIGRFYTPAQRAELQLLAQNKAVVQGSEFFGQTIKKIQQAIGEFEFDDANALVKKTAKNYAPHVLTPEMQVLVKTKSSFDAIKEVLAKEGARDGLVDMSLFMPGKTAYNKARKFEMSALEANNVRRAFYQKQLMDDDWFKANVPEDMVDQVKSYFENDMFSQDAKASIMDFMTTKYEAMNKNHKNTNVLLTMAFGDVSKKDANVRIVSRSAGVPVGFTAVPKEHVQQIRSMLIDTRKYAGKDETKQINKLIDMMKKGATSKSEGLIMENHVYKMMTQTQKDGFQAIEALDYFTGMYKKFKTASPAFNIRNVIGNMMNMWIGGMGLKEVPEFIGKADNYIRQYDGIAKKVTQSGLKSLTEEEGKIYKYYNDFLERGFFTRAGIDDYWDMKDEHVKSIKNALNSASGKAPKEIGAGQQAVGKAFRGVDKTVDFVIDKNMKANLYVDRRARMAMYIYANEHPEYLAKMGFKDPMEAVRTVLFDPNDLTFFEQDVMKKIIPFYTFSRQNLAFHMKNAVKNSKKYYRLYKGIRSMWGAVGVDYSNLRDYERDQMYIPIPFLSKDGEYTALKASLPASDLFEFTSDPVGRVASALTPMIKAPIEAVYGRNMMTGLPISEYEGQMSKDIPWMTKDVAWALGNTGLDVPVKIATGAFDTVKNLATGQDATGSANRAFGMTYQGSEQKNLMAKEYTKIDLLEQALRKYKDSGKEIPTIDELNQRSNWGGLQAEVKSIDEIMNKYKKTR